MSKDSPVIIAPSLLSADSSCLREAIRVVESGGGDWIHLDIMDGSFVPNITFGPQIVKDLRTHTGLPFDVHLMVSQPERHLESFAAAGADIITVHAESIVHLHRSFKEIRRLGKKAGVSLVPSSPAGMLAEVLSWVDLVLVMTVDPGFGGQTLIPETLAKVAVLRDWKRQEGYSYLIEVDGGINRETSRLAREAGAEVLVAGSAIFNSKHPEEEIRWLRQG